MCCVQSDAIRSTYPRCYGKLWGGVTQQRDEYGRADRRLKNDEAEKRAEILRRYEQREEYRELLFVGTGYLLGGMNKEYGRLRLYTVERIEQAYLDQEKRELDIRRNEASTQGKPLVTQTLQSRVPTGQERFALNLITQTEVQNAVTSLQV